MLSPKPEDRVYVLTFQIPVKTRMVMRKKKRYMMIYSVSLVIGHLRVKKRKYGINSKYFDTISNNLNITI